LLPVGTRLVPTVVPPFAGVLLLPEPVAVPVLTVLLVVPPVPDVAGLLLVVPELVGPEEGVEPLPKATKAI
jgi:hypothetical protein